MFLISFLELLFVESCVMLGGFWQALSPLPGCFMMFIFFIYYQHGQYVKGVTIIESSLGMRRGDPLGNPLYALAHY